jgi:hypothetical protein
MGALVRGSAKLTDDEKRKILGANALDFFGLSPRAGIDSGSRTDEALSLK